MENPKTWTEVHWLIHNTIIEHNKDLEDLLCGHSLEYKIYHALLEGGFLNVPLATSDKKD